MIYLAQVLAGTTADLHGENFIRHELENFCAKLPDYVPINTMHDIGSPALGIVRNLRVIPVADTSDWQIVGDIEIGR